LERHVDSVSNTARRTVLIPVFKRLIEGIVTNCVGVLICNEVQQSQV
jgi:hypothetical protein